MKKLENWVIILGLPFMLLSIVTVISVGVYLYKNNITLF